jgi:hypothetical protein
MPIFPKNKFIQKVTKGSCRLVSEPTLDKKIDPFLLTLSVLDVGIIFAQN